MNRFRTSFDIGSVLSWFLSYLSNRTRSVRIGHHSSTPTRCTTGVPQGSVLGPLLFATYTSLITTITRSFQVCHQQYADDTQLFIALNPSDPSFDIANLTTCLHTLQSWFCLSRMALNPDKSDAILLGGGIENAGPDNDGPSDLLFPYPALLARQQSDVLLCSIRS